MEYGEQFGFAVGVIGLSPLSFYLLTPIEFMQIAEQYSRSEQIKMDMFGVAVYHGAGLMMGGKKYKPLFNEKVNTPKFQKVDPGVKAEDLRHLRDVFKLKQGGE